ncbi:MAG: FtsX-like permease family protein [Acutalibacteraceae bacterium]
MKAGFFPKLAMDGIRKNKRIYFPYILTGTVMTMMSYIVLFLASSEMLEHMKGGGVLRTMLPLGGMIVTAFSLIFMFYSNSFLIRQRNREFGLYNVLGMDKGNLGRIMLWETLIAGGISIVGGLVFGVAFSKLAELCMHNLLEEEITYTLRIDFASAGKVALLFAGIYVLLLLNSLIKVRRSNPLELLHSSNVGEKPPKANWLFAIAGILILAVAYYIALSIKQPLTAIALFMIAVVMVIIATYLLFVSGSVVFCRLLQKNKRYYYKANHFISVSSMVYRMKRNGAGLASICVLNTIVLVMLSATLSLYIGAEDSLAATYPRDISLRLFVPSMEYFNEGVFLGMRNDVDNLVPVKEDVLECSGVDIAGLFTQDGILVDQKLHKEFAVSTYENLGYLHIITIDDYNRLMGTNETLEKDECLLHCYRTEYSGDTFTIENCTPLKVKSVIDDMYVSGYAAVQVVPTVTLVTTEIDTLIAPIVSVENSLGNSILEIFWSYEFNLDAEPEAEIDAYNQIGEEIKEIAVFEDDGSYRYNLNCRERGRSEFFGMYAGLFFIGILLSIVFLFAAVLIIYYKQISEGYEDQKRFEVMQKVGMTMRDVRKSINSQVLTVFFLPLLFAGLHLVFAFPILWKLLQMFNFNNELLMMMVTAAGFFVFALAYALVYKITSNAYYTIVSGRKV